MKIKKKVKKIWNILNAHFRRNSVVWLRKCGAVVGEDVHLIGHFCCSPVDATCLEIGNHVVLVGTQILTHDASLKTALGRYCVRIGRVVIGDHVFVGLNSIILPNVRIGSNVIIGAGSVVSSDIPDNVVAAGNPARVIRPIDAFADRIEAEIADGENVVYGLNRAGMSPQQRADLNERLKKGPIYVMTEKSK